VRDSNHGLLDILQLDQVKSEQIYEQDVYY